MTSDPVLYEEILRENQIDLFGGTALPEEMRVMPSLPYAISFCLPLSAAVVTEVKKGPTKLYFHHYRTANAYLDRVAMQVMQSLMGQGFDAAYVPASQSVSDDGLYGLISHKAVANLAGLGSVGQNALLLTEKYGPAVRLSTVLTSMPLLSRGQQKDICDGCGACVRACPSGALAGTCYRPGMARGALIDAEKCSRHMKKAYGGIGRGAVCGICMAVCPKCYGNRTIPSAR